MGVTFDTGRSPSLILVYACFCGFKKILMLLSLWKSSIDRILNDKKIINYDFFKNYRHIKFWIYR